MRESSNVCLFLSWPVRNVIHIIPMLWVQNKQCNVNFAQMNIVMFVQCNVIFVQQTMQVESSNVCSLLPHELCLFVFLNAIILTNTKQKNSHRTNK